MAITWNTTLLLILGVLLILAVYLLYTCHFSATKKQRVIPEPTVVQPTLRINFLADAVLNKDDELFLMEKLYSGPGEFPTMFTEQELQQLRTEATKFFKDFFEVSDLHLRVAMTELRVNPTSNYRVEGGGLIADGGFVVPIPKGMKLHGVYGGKEGVAADHATILAYGHYVLPNGYRIAYMSTCPMSSFSTFDGDYSPIDCDIQVLASPKANEVGLIGKAIGVYKNTTVQGRKQLIQIRNMLTFPKYTNEPADEF